MAVSVQRALDRKSDEHKEEMSEMENKVHDMQKGACHSCDLVKT